MTLCKPNKQMIDQILRIREEVKQTDEWIAEDYLSLCKQVELLSRDLDFDVAINPKTNEFKRMSRLK